MRYGGYSPVKKELLEAVGLRLKGFEGSTKFRQQLGGLKSGYRTKLSKGFITRKEYVRVARLLKEFEKVKL